MHELKQVKNTIPKISLTKPLREESANYIFKIDLNYINLNYNTANELTKPQTAYQVFLL